MLFVLLLQEWGRWIVRRISEVTQRVVISRKSLALWSPYSQHDSWTVLRLLSENAAYEGPLVLLEGRVPIATGAEQKAGTDEFR